MSLRKTERAVRMLRLILTTPRASKPTRIVEPVASVAPATKRDIQLCLFRPLAGPHVLLHLLRPQDRTLLPRQLVHSVPPPLDLRPVLRLNIPHFREQAPLIPTSQISTLDSQARQATVHMKTQLQTLKTTKRPAYLLTPRMIPIPCRELQLPLCPLCIVVLVPLCLGPQTLLSPGLQHCEIQPLQGCASLQVPLHLSSRTSREEISIGILPQLELQSTDRKSASVMILRRQKSSVSPTRLGI